MIRTALSKISAFPTSIISILMGLIFTMFTSSHLTRTAVTGPGPLQQHEIAKTDRNEPCRTLASPMAMTTDLQKQSVNKYPWLEWEFVFPELYVLIFKSRVDCWYQLITNYSSLLLFSFMTSSPPIDRQSLLLVTVICRCSLLWDQPLRIFSLMFVMRNTFKFQVFWECVGNDMHTRTCKYFILKHSF